MGERRGLYGRGSRVEGSMGEGVTLNLSLSKRCPCLLSGSKKRPFRSPPGKEFGVYGLKNPGHKEDSEGV